MLTDVIYPLLIAAGCLVIVIVVHLLTRPRPSRADIRLPDGGTVTDDGEPTRQELERWHRDHEAAVLDYLDAQDPAPDWSGDDDEHEQVAERFDEAIEAHPAPEMRAELAALRAAADSLAAARDRDDDDAAARHGELYLEYRTSWLERLRQFPADEDRLKATAARELAASDESDNADADTEDTVAEDAEDGESDTTDADDEADVD